MSLSSSEANLVVTIFAFFALAAKAGSAPAWSGSTWLITIYSIFSGSIIYLSCQHILFRIRYPQYQLRSAFLSLKDNCCTLFPFQNQAVERYFSVIHFSNPKYIICQSYRIHNQNLLRLFFKIYVSFAMIK